jgi:glycosyltransferase involved in cell wall biosynthesis
VISIVIPTLGRAHVLAERVENISTATAHPHEIVFVVEPEDLDSIAAADAAGARVVVNERTASYSGAMNTAYAHGLAELVFAGADDLDFHPGWDQTALAHLDDQVMVVGTNDLINPYVAKGWHATHYLIDRRYLDHEGGTVDGGPGSWYHEGYDHNYTDTEFIGTAKARARFRPCLESVVRHVHAPSLGRPDATSERTLRAYAADSALYDTRRELWWSLAR